MRDMQVVAQARPSPATLCARAALKPCPACLHVRLPVMSGNSLPPELYAAICLDWVKSMTPPDLLLSVAFLQVMRGDSLPPELCAVTCLDSVKHGSSEPAPFCAFLQVMSCDSLPPELYRVLLLQLIKSAKPAHLSFRR